MLVNGAQPGRLCNYTLLLNPLSHPSQGLVDSRLLSDDEDTESAIASSASPSVANRF
jgi:hypothetical protein